MMFCKFKKMITVSAKLQRLYKNEASHSLHPFLGGMKSLLIDEGDSSASFHRPYDIFTQPLQLTVELSHEGKPFGCNWVGFARTVGGKV